MPWLDNLLVTVAAPAAITADVIATATVTPELSPLMRWTLALVAGGGTAGLVHAGTALLRLKSSALTVGVGNPVVATGGWPAPCSSSRWGLTGSALRPGAGRRRAAGRSPPARRPRRPRPRPVGSSGPKHGTKVL